MGDLVGGSGLFLVGLLGGGPLHLLVEIYPVGGDPFVETFVELNIMDIEFQSRALLLDRQYFCFPRLAIFFDESPDADFESAQRREALLNGIGRVCRLWRRVSPRHV